MQNFLRLRRPFAGLLLLALLMLPASAARASHDDTNPEHKIGVALAVVCGVTARVAVIAPVPFAGIAVVSCLASFLDALNTPD